MAKVATTVEQSKQLLKLGLDADTADMFYPQVDEGIYSDCAYPKECDAFRKQESDIPAWSLSALMEIVEDTFGKDFSYQEGEWQIIVWDTWFGYKRHYFEELPNLVGWALENGCLKNE